MNENYEKYIGKVVRHFKGNYYYIENVALYCEDCEPMIIYRALYENKDSQLWIRPAKMFFGEIDPNRQDNITGQKHRMEICTDLEIDYTKK